jgi:hypothetical protein
MKFAVSPSLDIVSIPDNRGVYTVPNDGQYWQSVQDIYSGAWFDQNNKPCPRSMTKWRNPPYMALPSTVPMDGAGQINEFFPLTKPWQEFWRDCIDYASEFTLSREVLPLEQLTERHLLYWYAYATQHSLALTDNHAAVLKMQPDPNGFADYLLGINPTRPPIAIKSLSMSGNLYKQLDMTGSHLIVETLNAGELINGKFIVANPPKVSDVWNKSWLIHWGVQSTANYKMADGGYPQESFPPDPFGMPFPLMGIGGINKVALNRVRRVRNNDTYSPYK